MGYQALYRAWRPEKFEDVVGQEAIIKTLVAQVESGRVAHAYLFCGSRGTGKTSTAKILARAINCERPRPGADPCGQCDACVSIGRERAMDVVEIDAASNNGVDEIRDLREKIQYPPSVGRYKVYIIDEVHMLSTGAFNALLKTLEEPPAHAVFILATTEPQKLPATVLSRCQRFDFRRIPARLIEKRLRQVVDAAGATAQDEALALIARAAEGGMRDALSLLDTCMADELLTADRVREALGASGRASMYAFADALIASDAGRALTLVGQAIDAGRDPAVFSREVTAHLRGLLLAQAVEEGLEDLIESSREEAQRLRAQASGAPTEALTRWMELFMRAEGDMKWMAQPRSALELCAVRACRPELEQDVEALAERLAKLEARLESLAAIPLEPAAALTPEQAGGPPSRLSAPGQADGPPPWQTAPERADGPPPWQTAPEQADGQTPSQSAPGQADDPPRTPPPEGAAQAGTSFGTGRAKASAPKGARTDRLSGADAWARALETVSKEHPQIFGMLKEAVYRGLDGDSALLELPRTRAFYRQILEKDDKRALIDQALTAAFERQVSVRFVQASIAPKADARTLEQAYEVFGRDKVSVLDE